MCGARRETTIFGRTRTTGYTHFDIHDDRLFSIIDTVAKSYTDASIIWRVSLYGRSVIERTAIFRPHIDYVHAGQIPARFYVFTTGI